MRDNYAQSCFVATVVYGSENHPSVEILRDIRDNVLGQSRLGRVVSDLYYSGTGKRAAQIIETRLPSAIPLIKLGLDAIVSSYKRNKDN